ncbi:MAG: hypothetical protein ACI8UO_002471, partial [Verrucomicrobiales bacterium]
MAKKSKRAGWIIVGLFLTVGTVFFWLMSGPKYFSSPTASRNTPGYQSGWASVFESWPPEQQNFSSNPGIPMGSLKRAESDGVIQFTWPDQKLPKVPLPPHEVPALESGQVELFAFATWHPAAEDPLDPDESWSAPLILRDPETLRKIEDIELDELGVRTEWRKFGVKKISYWPWLRLIFRTKNMLGVR